MKNRATMLLLCLLILSAKLFAQETLMGMVMEETKNGKFKPIPFANVFWLGTQTGAVTDTNGSFEIPLVANINSLVVSYVGYKNDTLHITKKNKLTIVLRPYEMLDEVNVVYEKRGTEISYLDPLKVENIGEKELFKAACCNLSESFETNPSVDVAYADAVTGTKQIQMLGLDGKYAQITRESMPDVRGLSAVQGLTYIPGTWIESLQLNKGAGSVVNGFESLTGQINVELKKPENADPLFVNAYVNQGGRTELNVDAAHKFNEKVSTMVLVHGNMRPIEVDGNNDGFLDFPTGQQINVVNRWKFTNNKGWEGQLAGRGIVEDRTGGQYFGAPEDTAAPQPYKVHWKTNRAELWGKTGYVFKNAKFRSVGFQGSVLYHDYKSGYGNTVYNANQQSGYVNSIYQDILGTTTHKYKVGLSLMYDKYDEQLNGVDYNRTEIVPGAFAEYTFTYFEKFALVAGLRADYHNYYGLFFTPRLHMRYEFKEGSVLRVSGGKGTRTANVIADNQSLLASSRTWIILGDNQIQGFGLKQEKAWNFGANFTQNFRLNYRPATFALDVYHTEFENQTVIDREDPTKVRVYNLVGRSFATSLQAQVDYSIYRGFDARIAYRWYDVETDYSAGRLKSPFVASHRAFINLSYETKSEWKFDYTVQWQGKKRIPSTLESPVLYQVGSYSPDLFLMNAQITKSWGKKFALYVGMENITNVKQNNPVISASDPYGTYFDSSMVWGPIFGRMTYLGVRWSPKSVPN
jgi:outer membrane receptor for ferrienterochelin and colicins